MSICQDLTPRNSQNMSSTTWSSDVADCGKFCLYLTSRRLDLVDYKYICQDMAPMSQIYTKI